MVFRDGNEYLIIGYLHLQIPNPFKFGLRWVWICLSLWVILRGPTYVIHFSWVFTSFSVPIIIPNGLSSGYLNVNRFRLYAKL